MLRCFAGAQASHAMISPHAGVTRVAIQGAAAPRLLVVVVCKVSNHMSGLAYKDGRFISQSPAS